MLNIKLADYLFVTLASGPKRDQEQIQEINLILSGTFQQCQNIT